MSKSLLRLAPFALVAAGCAEPSALGETQAPPSRGALFAEASQTQRAAAVLAALGYPAQQGMFSLYAGWADSWSEMTEGNVSVAVPSGCPVTTAGAVYDASFDLSSSGCVGASGTEYKGAVEVENFTPYPVSLDVGGPISLHFDAWEAGTLVVDGSWSSEDAQVAGGEVASQAFDIQVTQADVAIGTRGTLDVQSVEGGNEAASNWQAGATGTVSGLGAFEIAGDFAYAGTALLGAITLTGADTLEVDLGDVDAGGCAAATIDGEPVERLCLFAPAEPEGDELEVYFGERTCEGDAWRLALSLSDEAGSVWAYTGSADTGELHEIPFLSKTENWDYLALLEYSDHVDEEHTRLACADDAAVLFVVEARDGGAGACATLGTPPSEWVENECAFREVVALDR